MGVMFACRTSGPIVAPWGGPSAITGRCTQLDVMGHIGRLPELQTHCRWPMGVSRLPASRPIMLAWGVAAVALLLAAATTDTETPGRCLLMGDFLLPAQEAAGDILIGGLFPLHITVSEPELPFTKRPRQGRCSG